QVIGFKEGLVSVQDEAAQLSVPLLQLSAGQIILDACAAPGGKSTHMLEVMPNLSQLIVADVDAKRLKRVEENLQRLKYSYVKKLYNSLALSSLRPTSRGLSAGSLCMDPAHKARDVGQRGVNANQESKIKLICSDVKV